jgi:hypothetical protein
LAKTPPNCQGNSPQARIANSGSINAVSNHPPAQRTAFHRRDARLQSSSFARWSHFRNAPRFDATGAILTRLFGAFAPDFPHYISGKEFKK